MIKEKIRKKES